jgi:hypothetical protein
MHKAAPFCRAALYLSYMDRVLLLVLNSSKKILRWVGDGYGAFTPAGDPEAGVTPAVAAVPMWSQVSLIVEY